MGEVKDKAEQFRARAAALREAANEARKSSVRRKARRVAGEWEVLADQLEAGHHHIAKFDQQSLINSRQQH